MEESDDSLAARSKHDPAAFGILYERYANKIYNYIYYRTGNHHDAEDLTARTFQCALNKIAYYADRGAPFAAWLYRIAHNLVANWYRDHQRRRTITLDDVSENHEAWHTTHHEAPETVVETNEARRRLMAIIRRLPPERQQVLIFKFVERMSNAEIGKMMGRTEGAVKALYHRTLLGLRDKLTEAGMSVPVKEDDDQES